LNGNVLTTHATWHALILEDSSWELTATNGSNVTSNLVRTASHRLSLHSVTSYNALKSSADRNARHVNNLSIFEDVANLDLLTYLAPAKSLHVAANFLNVVERALGRFLELSSLSLGATLSFLRLETELHRVVSVALLSSNVENVTWPGLNDGDWDARAFWREHLRHSQLLS
jgi:hypothetical protein